MTFKKKINDYLGGIQKLVMDSSWNETFLDAEAHAYNSSDGSDEMSLRSPMTRISLTRIPKTTLVLPRQFNPETHNFFVDRWMDH